MDIGKIGVKAYLERLSGRETGEFARKVEQLGYSVLWIPESAGMRSPFAHAAYLLSHTERLIVGTSISNIWLHEPFAMIDAARTLAELFDDRFILGLGVGHRPTMRQHGIDYDKPLTHMRQYLDRMSSEPYRALRPKTDPPILIAALLPKMIGLVAEKADGIIPAMVTVEHTARMRAALGPNKWICTQQAALLEHDPAQARVEGRKFTGNVRLPNYQRSLRAVGFTDEDFNNGGSDRLVDAVVAWGSASDIRARIEAHYRAGANHVCITYRETWGPDSRGMRTLEALAPGR
jgi:probable F420-dependent oxidoreductase